MEDRIKELIEYSSNALDEISAMEVRIANQQRDLAEFKRQFKAVLAKMLNEVSVGEVIAVASELYWMDSRMAGPTKEAFNALSLKAKQKRQFPLPLVDENIQCPECNSSATFTSWTDGASILARHAAGHKPDVCQKCRNNANKASNDEYRDMERQKQDTLIALAELPWNEYIESSHWEYITSLAIKHSNDMCDACGSESRLGAYPKSTRFILEYSYWPGYGPNLAVLCTSCARRLYPEGYPVPELAVGGTRDAFF